MVSEHSVNITTKPRSRYRIQLPLPVTNADLARLDVRDSEEWKMMLELARKQEAWLVTLKKVHGLTNTELRKHCNIHETVYWPQERPDMRFAIKLTLKIHWTRWMRFKRWCRGN